MTLEQLQNDMIQAMKSNKPVLKQVLKELIGSVKNAAIEKRCRDNVPEELVNQVLLKEKKLTEEMIETCPVERGVLMSEYRVRLAIVESYCPKLLDNPVDIKSTIEKLCGECHAELTKNNKGAIMKIIMPYFKGKADMKVVNQVIGELLK